MQRNHPLNVRSPRLILIVLVIALGLLAGSCKLGQLSDDLEMGKPFGLVFAEVQSPEKIDNRVWVLLYRLDPEGPSLETVNQLSAAVDWYIFPADSRHRYRIVAFQDLDGNLVRGPGEPAGVAGTQPLTVAPNAKMQMDPLIMTRDAEVTDKLPLDLRNIDIKTIQALPMIAGEVISLDAERFSRQQAKDGMWTPAGASLEYGAGVFFLEEYDPGRIPVLFVHGVGGSPIDFRYFIENLDHEKYQVCVYHYPSGARLYTLARVLQGLIYGLQRELGFDTIFVTAHSMGGLVARSYILQAAALDNADFIKLFVSISTPYNGHEGASKGVKYLPVAVPCWLDMQPDSDFLQLVQEPLPEHIPFYLLFGHDSKGFNLVMNYSSDSVVSLRSQLAFYAQEEAVRTWGYDLAHVPILNNPEPFAKYTEILDQVRLELVDEE